MFLPTKPYNEFLENYNKEPSIRIGKRVPENAVNMAYYFNPTATDAERVLCSDAPRKTIDHRVEETYRYLFDMPEANDNLFEKTVSWNDEEGYSGILPRIWVKWYDKNHIDEKNMQANKIVIVDQKNDVPTSTSYEDDKGYTGNLFLDAVDYEIKNTKTEILNTTLYLEVKDHELMKSNITNDELNNFMLSPIGNSGSPWPKELYVKIDGVYDSSGAKWGNNPYDGYTSPAGQPLVFTNVEKDPIKLSQESLSNFSYQNEYGYISLYAKQYSSDPFTKTEFTTVAEINNFINMMSTFECDGANSKMGQLLDQWKNDTSANRARYELKIYRKDYDKQTVTGSGTAGLDGDYYLAGYNIVYTYKATGSDSANDWNVYANYSGVLTKPYEEIKITPVSWEATCHYTGIVRKVWKTYDGVAYYQGSIIKTEGMGNVNPELTPDILMYPDDDGYLRRIDVNGNYYYKIEAEQFYITDVFKDNVPCFFKYNLKYPIHDYRGPDDNGFYEGDAVKVYTSKLKNIPDSYKYQLKLQPAEYETVQEIIDGKIIETQKVKKYNASLYTSFISKTTDTYKATYNAYVDFNTDEIVNSNNGINEDVYNKPFMILNKDFRVVSINKATRTNKIHITNPNIIEDTRRYITFEYKVYVYKKVTGGAGEELLFVSNKRQAQILNKEYALQSEYNKFIDRAMIISPKEYENYLSPFDIIIKDQAIAATAPIVDSSNAHEFIFYCKPVEETLKSNFRGAINITCNPDGSGVLTAETTLDTGFYNSNTGTYTKKLVVNNPYIVENGKIYAGYMVRCLDVRNISVKQPREEHLLESWYPLIQFGHYSQVMDQYGAHTKVCYTMPEYDDQYWGQYGKPYVDVTKEKAVILNTHMIKVRNHPLYLRDDINTVKVIRVKETEEFEISITNISFSEGIIITKEAISENDIILVDYTYLEEYYVYRGFNRNMYDYCRIDLNPNQYHTYSDLNKEPSEYAPTKNLFNKTIYFYLRPTIRYEIDDENDDLINTNEELDRIILENKETLYHTIDKYEPESPLDIYIGSVYIRQNTSLHSTVLIDTRTRGGGVLEEMKDSLRKQLEPESDFYLDIGCYDGTPYQENAVIIVRLDNSILKEYGGRFTQTDIEERVKKWLGIGVYPIIEYVDSYSKFDMPQYNLIVEDSYTNVINQTPELTLECISV